MIDYNHHVKPKKTELDIAKPAQSRYTVGDLMINYLEQLSIEYIFGVPGGAIEPLYNALAASERRHGPRAIVARHETGAALMAEGYALQTGGLGVCCATTGPGATNLITGLATACASNVPVLAITAQTALNTFGKATFQESSCTGINTIGMFQFCTKFNTLVSHIEQFERKLATAIISAFESPRGPVHLSIPMDVMAADPGVTSPSFDLLKMIATPSVVDEKSVESLFTILSAAHKVVFLVGENAGEAIGSIYDAALLLDAIILTTPHGKGLVNPYHPRYRGVVGFAGHESARQVLRDTDVDVVVAVGASLGEWSSSGWDAELVLNQRLIHIDEQSCYFSQSPMARLHVRGRILSVFEHLVNDLRHSSQFKHLTESPPTSSNISHRQRHFDLYNEKDCLEASQPIKPQRLMHDLTELLPPNTHYLADTGASFAWAIHYLHPFDRRMNGKRNAGNALFRSCLEFSPMGWAIGCAVGIALAKRENPVVCITGDGSWLMSGQEITVALQEQLTVIYVVLNDSSLGMVKHGQRLSGAEQIGIELPNIDFANMARAMGIEAYRIVSSEQLRQLDIKKICKRRSPTLLDVCIDTDEVPPIGTRVGTLRSAHE